MARKRTKVRILSKARRHPKVKHIHDFVWMGYGGAGWSIYRCKCGAEEIDA